MADQQTNPAPIGNKNEKIGEVVSARMQKTIVVEVTRRVPHPVTATLSESEILMQIQADVSEDVPSALAPGELLVAGAEEPPPAPVNVARRGRKSSRR